jgi:leucyl aminopeptidase
VTTFTLRKGSPAKSRSDAVVVGVCTSSGGPVPAPGAEAVASAYGKKFAALLSTVGFEGKAGQVAKVPSGDTLKSPLLVLVGLGPADELTANGVRRGAGVAGRALARAEDVVLALPARDATEVRAVAEGWLLGGYTFTAFKSAPAPTPDAQVTLLTDAARSKDAQAALETAQVVAAAVARTRDWVNTPPGDLTPPLFADAAAAAAKQVGRAVKVQVLDERELRDGGFGGIVAVGQGSDNPPRLVRLTYKPRGAKTHLALVGKGITFDSGGLWLKPGASMATMKSDMGGAAAVIAATLAIAELGLPIAVTAYAPMAENMVSGTAQRPGDVVTMYGGKTVEVLNTDAEGRLVLGDALVLASEQQPDLVVDVATLTGACEQALGDRVAGVMANDDDLAQRTIAAGDRAGEALWQLPISEEMPVKVRTYSKVADLMQHNVDRFGGALYAAAFLQEFVGDGLPWAHLDIAGPSFNTGGPYGHVPTGGTGAATATLVELATELAQG